MNNNEIVHYITNGRQIAISNSLVYWVTCCGRFKDFLIRYQNKIRKKISNEYTDENLEAIQAELEVAYLLLLDGHFEVEYEKYGVGNCRAPDFSIIFDQSIVFNIEVKWIRESDLGLLCDKTIGEIICKIENMPSDLSFGLFVSEEDNDYTNLVMKLKSSKEKIIQYIKDTIRREEKHISYGNSRDYSIPGLKDAIILILTKPLNKTLKETSYHGGNRPIFYNRKEFHKFGDTILEKLGQMRQNEINLLIISSNSTTHEPRDLVKAINSVSQILIEGNEKFFIRKKLKVHGREDFLRQAQDLSGILCKFNWEKNYNLLWCNGKANKQIPKILRNYLPKMGKS